MEVTVSVSPHGRHARRRRAIAPAAALVIATAGIATLASTTSAGAVTQTKFYSVSSALAPCSGGNFSVVLTVKNETSSKQSLGSVNLTLPSVIVAAGAT